jgi:hypothetical protein
VELPLEIPIHDIVYDTINTEGYYFGLLEYFVD